MKISAIKKLNEKMPYWMKRPFSRIIRKRLISNKVFLEQYELLDRIDGMTEQEISKLQMENLKRTLTHAYQHTAYYRELMDSVGFDPESVTSFEDLKRLPVLTKELLKENYEKIQADDIDNFYDVRTGGTTGEPTHVLMEKDAIYQEWAFTYHYWSKFGYDFRASRLATLRGVDLHGKLYEINPLYQEIRLNIFKLNHDNLKEYIQGIDRYGADFIYGYPSAVYQLCRLAKEAGIKLERRFKAALLISENLYDFQEREIKEVLACPIAIFYGHSERAVYAEKYDRGYVFQPLYGVTEINENGHPIVTGFINEKTPLIRYEIDDHVELKSENNRLGGVKPFSVYHIWGHRDREVLYGSNGEQISVAAINFHDETFDAVEGYQFIQTIPGRCVLNVLLPDKYKSESNMRLMQTNVGRKLAPSIECEVRFVSSLQLTERGKYQMIIQKCPK